MSVVPDRKRSAGLGREGDRGGAMSDHVKALFGLRGKAEPEPEP
jgi:hypothetical protein